MKLETYIRKTGIKKIDLARQAKISPAWVTFLLKGAIPSPKVAFRIEKVTKGMVTRMELLYP